MIRDQPPMPAPEPRPTRRAETPSTPSGGAFVVACLAGVATMAAIAWAGFAAWDLLSLFLLEPLP